MMKISLPGPTASLFASALVTTSLLISPRAHAQGDEPKTPLSQEMGGICRDARSLRKLVADPAQKDAALAAAKDMEAHATKAKGFDPSKAREIPAAGKDQFIADYKKQMDGLITDIQKLEDAIKTGNTTDASAMLDKIQGDKREGHKKFNSDNHGPGAQGGPGGAWGGPGGNRPPMPPPPTSGT